MSKAQIWTVVILGAFVILFFVQKILKEDETHPMMNNNSGTATETNQNEGMGLAVSFGCITCHGEDLRGTSIAPTLYGLSEYYDRNNMINYLRNPSSFMGEGRLKEFKEKYKSVMPSYNNKDVKDLGKISDYLLKLK